MLLSLMPTHPFLNGRCLVGVCFLGFVHSSSSSSVLCTHLSLTASNSNPPYRKMANFRKVSMQSQFIGLTFRDPYYPLPGGISMRTKLRIFNSNVKSVLLYGCETWRTTQTMQRKIQTFFNTCLRRIYKIQWQEKIRNEELWERAGQEPVAKQILRRKWGWIGHTLRKPASSTTRQALTWNPQGKRKRGRPRNSWRRDTEAELKQQGTNWSGMTRAAQNRVRWRGVVDGLCSTGSDGHK